MPEIIENQMVVDSECGWEEEFLKISEENSKKLNRNGYSGINTGIFVPEEDAFSYAMERVSQNEDLEQEFRDMVVEWFYSGNWVKEE